MLCVKVSAVIIAFNEELNVGDAIRSVAWADEILVVDSESTDRTREIAEGLGAKVVVRPWPGFAAQKQFAVESAENDWVLSLDADERVTEELRTEIQAVMGEAPTFDGYSVPRRSVYLGRRIRGGGWYPDRQLRLFNRTKGRWNGRIIHESYEMEPDARVGKLNGDLLHYSVESPRHHSRMITERYAPLGARQMLAEGKRTSPLRAAISGLSTFIRTYFLKLGFLDGFPGLLIAYFAAHNSFLKHLILLELQASRQAPQPTLSSTTTKTKAGTSNLSKTP